MASKLEVSHSKAEAKGWRAYVEVIKGGRRKILKTKWFDTEKAAKYQAAAWKRMYL